MIDYFAGKYFVQEGLIKADKLGEIMTRQGVVRKNFNKLEKDHGSFLEENQIMLIRLLQHTIDEKLGDLASEYGNDDEKFKLTIMKQQVLNTAFFDQLIVEGILTPDLIAPMLEKFRNHYALNHPGISRHLKEDFDSILREHVNTGDYYANEYINIAIKYILRFVGTNIKLDKAPPTKSYSANRVAIQKVVTETDRYFLGICGEKLVMQAFNDSIESIFSVKNRKDTRYSAICGLLDCVSNIFQVLIMKEKNVFLVDISNVYKFATITSEKQVYSLPLTVRDMPIEIIAGYGVKPNFAYMSHNI